MTYRVNNEIVSLPLTENAILHWIKEKIANEDLKDANIMNAIKATLYKDVLICIKSNASHAKELINLALKLEDDNFIEISTQDKNHQ